MRFLLLLCLSLKLIAFDSASASKIFDKIFHAMIDKETISVYTSNKVYTEVVLNAKNLSLSTDYTKADIILIDSFLEIPKNSDNMLLFTTSFPVLRDKENVVGAFYWDRGRIKIEFIRPRLLKHNIKLPESFKKYVKEEL